MNRHQRIGVLAAVAVAVLLTSADTLQANGQEFFSPATGPVTLAYFGRVRDAKTGRLVTTLPYVTILERATGLYFPFTGDGPGHFKSPDIGAQIKEVSNGVIDPSQFEVTIIVAGYKTIENLPVPRKTSGLIELNVKMVPKDSPAAAGAGGSDSSSGGGQTLWMLLVGGMALATIAMMARTLILPRSTTH